MPDTKAQLVSAGDKFIGLTPGALSFLVRHSFRDGIFVFMNPYPNEIEESWTPADLIAVGVDAGWFVPAAAIDTVRHWARVDDLKSALIAAGLPPKGKRAELLAACLAQCPAWVESFAGAKSAFFPTDKGRIELQATRPVVEPETKESHRTQMLGYLDRDIADACRSNVVIGFTVVARNDGCWAPGQCPRAAQFEGVYLPDELPDLYPADCPCEQFCSCIFRNTVLSCDESAEGSLLRQKLADRGLPQPPPPWNYEKALAEVEALERAKAERIAAAAAKKPTALQRLLRLVLG